MVTAESIKNQIEAGLPCELVHVEGDDGYHFSAIIVSGEFRGKNIVRQHQLVYGALGDRMKQEIHALSMKTLTPEQWAASNQADVK
jgi:acid stress-induced BolA-like protein IbaG/YrbA